MDDDYQEPIQDTLFEVEPEWDEDAMYAASVRWFRRIRGTFTPDREVYKINTRQWNAEFLRHLEAKHKPFPGKIKWHPLDRPGKVG